MITDEIKDKNINNVPPVIHLRSDGRYLASLQLGQPIMIGVYGASEEEAMSLYNERLRNRWGQYRLKNSPKRGRVLAQRNTPQASKLPPMPI